MDTFYSKQMLVGLVAKQCLVTMAIKGVSLFLYNLSANSVIQHVRNWHSLTASPVGNGISVLINFGNILEVVRTYMSNFEKNLKKNWKNLTHRFMRNLECITAGRAGIAKKHCNGLHRNTVSL